LEACLSHHPPGCQNHSTCAADHVLLSFIDALDKPVFDAIEEANRPCLLVDNGMVMPSPRLLESKDKEPHYETLRPFVGWQQPSDVVIKSIFEVTTSSYDYAVVVLCLHAHDY
jgi:hypothetical protein